MIDIVQIKLNEIKLKLVEPFQISSGTTTERRIIILKLTDRSGASAYAECVAGEVPNYFPENTDTAWLMITQFLSPVLLNNTFNHPSEVADALQAAIKGNNMAKAALEMGTWNLSAIHAQKSLASYIGGTQPKVASGISIGIQKSPEILVEKVRDYLAQGYRKVKLKIKPGADIDFVKAVRDTLGNDVCLMVDANNAYTLNDLELLKGLDDFDLLMIEQPLAWDDVFEHAQVQAKLKTPVCLDESISSVKRAEEMVNHNSGRIINIKAGRVGGFSEAIRIHDYCQSQNIPVWCGGMLETGIGKAYNIALASLPNFTLPGDLSPSRRYWVQDIVTPAWDIEKGWFSVPMGTIGLGVDVDEAYIDKITVREKTLR